MMDKVDNIISVIKSCHAPNWEVYAFQLGVAEKQFRNYDVEIERSVENFGYSIRVVNPKKGIGLAPGNFTDPNGIKKCLEQAQLAAKVSKSLPYNFPNAFAYIYVEIEDPKVVNDPVGVIDDKSEELMSLLKDRKDVTPTFGKLRSYVVDTVLVNSEDVYAQKRETLLYLELALKASLDSRLAEYWPKVSFRRVRDMKLEKRIPEWSDIAVDTLRAKIPESKEMTVIMTPEIIGQLIPPVVGFNATGSAKYKKLSRFSEGQNIAGENITIDDDGTYPYGIGSSPFDDEGVGQRTTQLIKKGVFKSFIYDNTFGPLMNKNSTGNGVRTRGQVFDIESKHTIPVSNGITNMYIEPGNMTLEGLIADTKDGLFVQQFSWLSPDEMTSSFGSEIRNARLIKNGELSDPVKGGLVSGYVLDSTVGEKQIIGLLKRVSGMTRNFDISGRCIAPYMRFEGVQVAGK